MADISSSFGPIISSIFSSAPPKTGSPDAAYAGVISDNATTQAPPSSPLEALNQWEMASDRSLNNYRDWLTVNTIKWLADWIRSPEEKRSLSEVKGTFAAHVAGHFAVAIPVVAIVENGIVKSGEHVVARLFITESAAKWLGGFVGFVVVTLIETALLGVFDKTDEVVGYTADRISEFVIGVVNPIVNDRQAQVRELLQALRLNLIDLKPSDSTWRRIQSETMDAIRTLDESRRDVNDLHLYRLMALMSGVYSGSSVPADSTPVVTLPAVDHALAFTMEHTLVAGQTAIDVLTDKSSVVVFFDSEEYVSDVAGGTPMGSGTPLPPSEFFVTLFEKGTISDTDISVARTYNVGGAEYGTWFNVPKGMYYLRIERSQDHPIGVQAQGKYWVASGL